MYSDDLIIDIQTLYIFLTFFWGLLIWVLKLWKTDIIGGIILLVPLFVFTISYFSLDSIDKEVHESMGKFNVVAIGLLAATILINWHTKSEHNLIWIRSLLIIAILILMVSVIDVWVSRRNYILLKHLRTGLQAISLSLLSYALYQFYHEVCMKGECTPRPVKKNKHITTIR